MGDFIKLLRQRIEESKKTLQSIEEKEEDLAQKKARAQKDLQGYQVALTAELRREGKEPIPEPSGSVANGSNGHQPVTNKTKFIGDVIKESGARGTTYGEIKKALKDRNLAFHPNYPYHVVAGMKEKNTAEERDGRIYAA